MSERAQILIRHAVDLKVFRDDIMPAGARYWRARSRVRNSRGAATTLFHELMMATAARSKS
jgi:hypothetical protein